jgi:hypothetical protein
MRRSLKHAAGNVWKMTVGSAPVDVALKDLENQTERALKEMRRSKGAKRSGAVSLG